MTDRLTGGFFRSTIESSMDSVRVLDLDGRLIFMNRGGLTAFEIDDFTPLAGRACPSLWPEPAATQIRIGIAAALDGRTHRFEGMCPTSRGGEKWWDVYIAPVRDDDGVLSAIIATSRDITASHHLREQAERRALALDRKAAALRSASRIAHVGGFEVTFDPPQVLFSPELCELLGLPPSPPIPLEESLSFWIEEDRQCFVQSVERARTLARRLVFNGRTRAADGSIQSWRLLGEPAMEGGRCVALRGAAQDMTDWLAMQERERSARETADNLSGFLATMGHELRTPLNGVLGMTQALGRTPLTEPQREHVAVIQASGEALLSLLNDLLDFSKIEAGKLELEDGVVDCEVLAEAVGAVFGPIARDKGLAFTAGVDADARGCWRGDPTRIRQVLHNLVSNAVKFTAAGSVEVRISRTADRLTFTVTDTGIGIAADKLAAIFDKFVQADATITRRYGGSGLGLSICRELADLMGGDIQVRSAVGRGTAFTFSLPLSPAAEAFAAPAVEPAAEWPDAGSPLRVLAAEDNPNNQFVLKTLLGAAGIEPIIVANGQEAVEAWGRDRWDVILMDIQMPVMDGVAAVMAIRDLERAAGRRRTPVIAVTANAVADQQAGYLAAGMDAVVAKPVNLVLLLNAIGDVLAPHAQEDGARPAVRRA